ncbi:hydroxyacylglutathione hydrolase [Lysobacter sp. MMG2]|uniref:hydroxyacylglutathione hydrolase n=1 Tax=Lysobacter sp. MMG2 TaxID=2801338 RepID=UPI001C222350|nr:hydroxyacylglutathione hydrolase [Lysobacter sp. MMG2]MBU8976277.1 hydroxyacylglutathione hydrolase [Lysobacter sp. MMG2]
MHLTPLPALSDNYIWTLSGEGGMRALIVDPSEAGPVLAAAEHGLQPAGVLLTHHHGDHIGGVPGLLERWPDLPVFAPDDDRIPASYRRVGDGDAIGIAGWEFNVLAVPGHTRSHVAYHGHGLLFCGDTLFSLGCGRMFEGTPGQMHASLSRLAALPPETRVCCGHEYTLANAAFALVVEPGNRALRRRIEEAQAMRETGRPTLPSLLGDELAANPFLRVDSPEVRASLARETGQAPADSVDAFAALRRWKDGFVA